jgi:hypothetical protein
MVFEEILYHLIRIECCNHPQSYPAGSPEHFDLVCCNQKVKLQKKAEPL